MHKPYVGYNETYQTREREPDAYENLLGDALEEAFREGVDTLEGIVVKLQKRGVPAAGGGEWSVAVLTAELTRLGV